MQYKFVGSGAGIPGLPHTVSQEEIDQFSPALKEAFEQALADGAYVEASDQPDQPDQPRRSRSKKSVSVEEGE